MNIKKIGEKVVVVEEEEEEEEEGEEEEEEGQEGKVLVVVVWSCVYSLMCGLVSLRSYKLHRQAWEGSRPDGVTSDSGWCR
ncbi:hypothetical protein E2C01_002877 [Portunus trituberculatus]|uniref:Uncharacterized protein n=1 Tax=Portunus trituberculatus TaxID=210409 RepID=A0A5B7CLX2_PORTR|nr:hypothetical protein [Portunus trituberculatus]